MFFLDSQLKMTSLPLDEFYRLSERARSDLLLGKSDTTMLKYLQGQVKDQVMEPREIRTYALNNLSILQHVYRQLKSNIDFNRTQVVPIDHYKSLSEKVSYYPGSIGYNTLTQSEKDRIFVDLFNMGLGILKKELSVADKLSVYTALFRLGQSHADYLSRHPKVNRVLKEKIRGLSFSENERERMVGKTFFGPY